MLTWRDWLAIPMAAPETRRLRAMRMTVLALCAALFVSLLVFDPLRAAIGLIAGGLVGGLLMALLALVPVYVITKNRADDRYLDSLGSEGGR